MHFADDVSGLWTGTGGFLRSSVRVGRGEDAWLVQHSIWELAIPAGVVDRDAELTAFLQRKRSARDLGELNTGGRNLIRLLSAQGCTTFDGTRSFYTLDEVRLVVESLVSQWYGLYFSHPFWAKLRAGQLSLAQVFAWVLRTYHLSRSAGPTAARGAVFSPTAGVREVFLKSAIEEYSHCEIYYKPLHARFGLTSHWITHLLPTPSGLAFDQHMSVMAEDDWLAHAISSYFQEYTAAFRENAFALYDRLERDYGLDGFFKGWKDHIGYDVDQTHADDFLDLFRGTETVSRTQLLRSIDAAAATVEFLIGALDELAETEPNLEIQAYRVSPVLVMQGAGETTVLGGAELSRSLLASNSQEALTNALADFMKASCGEPGSFLNQYIAAEFMTGCAKRALSVASEHREIVNLGRFMENWGAVASEDQFDTGLSVGGIAVRNFIRESTRSPERFLFLMHLFVALGWLKPMPGFGAKSAEMSGDHFDPVTLATLGVQFAELCCRHQSGSWGRVGRQDLLLSELASSEFTN